MKLTLVALTLTFSTLWSPAYTQTDSVYCIPISKARLLIADALRLRVSDSLNTLLSSRVDLLQSRLIEDHKSYTNLLKISEDNLKDQKAISEDFQKHSQSFADQLSYYEKINKKQKRQNTGLKILLGVAGGFIVYQSIN